MRRHVFLRVAQYCRIGLSKPFSLLVVARCFCVLRPEWCQKWCQHPHRVVVICRALRDQGAEGVLPHICFQHLRHTCAILPLSKGSYRSWFTGSLGTPQP
jgi:hypothetical protein